MRGEAKVIPLRPDAEPEHTYYPPRAPAHVCTRCGCESLAPGLCAACQIDDAHDGKPITGAEIVDIVIASILFVLLLAFALAVIVEVGRW